MYTFKNFCQEDKAIQLPDGTTKIIIASKGDGDDVSFELKCLLDYMNTRIVAGDLVTEIADAIKTVKKLEEEAVKYMTWKDLIDEEREEAKEEGRKEGREEGRKEGREEGRKEGREEGRKEGQKEGQKEGRIQSVRDLIQAGATTFEMVAKSGKYTAEELAAIAAKN